jgi:hypothetical protein
MRVEASNSKLRPKSPMHNGGPMVSSDLTFLTIGVDLTFLTIGVKDLNIKPRALCRYTSIQNFVLHYNYVSTNLSKLLLPH